MAAIQKTIRNHAVDATTPVYYVIEALDLEDAALCKQLQGCKSSVKRCDLNAARAVIAWKRSVMFAAYRTLVAIAEHKEG